MAATETFGAKLWMGDGGSPAIYSQVAGITSIPTVSSGSRSTIDISELSDTVKKFLAGMFDPGETAFDIIWDPRETTHGSASGLEAKSKQRGTVDFAIEVPQNIDGGAAQYIYFIAVVTGFNITAAQEDVFRATLTLKRSGDWYTDTAAPATS